MTLGPQCSPETLRTPRFPTTPGPLSFRRPLDGGHRIPRAASQDPAFTAFAGSSGPRAPPAHPGLRLPGQGPPAARGRCGTRGLCEEDAGTPGSDARPQQSRLCHHGSPAPSLRLSPVCRPASLVADRRHGALQLQEDHGGAVRQGERPGAFRSRLFPSAGRGRARACNAPPPGPLPRPPPRN